jgi:hypothetical protein
MKRFEPGTTYFTRSPGDHNCIIWLTVLSRTDKTIKATTSHLGEIKTFRPYEYDGAESVKPWGNYSLCPVVRADKTTELKPDWER